MQHQHIKLKGCPECQCRVQCPHVLVLHRINMGSFLVSQIIIYVDVSVSCLVSVSLLALHRIRMCFSLAVDPF
jgi:hypothetical protein